MRRGPAIVVGLFVAMAAAKVASACERRLPSLIEVAVETSGLAVRTDYTAADLRGMAANAGQQPPHAVLGAYADRVGYQTSSSLVRSSGCEAVKIVVRIIVKERVIEIGRDLQGKACLFGAALRHYAHHAQLQAEALQRSIASMRAAYQVKFADGRARGDPEVWKVASERDARQFVADWLDGFHDTLPAVNASGDTGDEVQALDNACGA